MGNAQSAWAAKGEYARMELDGRGGSSVSSLGANDIPGAGKIDPYENREAANAEYATRMSDEDMLSSVRSKALEMKTKTFTAVAASIDKQDWNAPLHIAAYCGKEAVAELLLRHKADVNMVGKVSADGCAGGGREGGGCG